MQARNRILFVLASGFVLLGMTLTVPGVTWPSVAESFGRPLAELGYVTFVFGGGYTLSSVVSGRTSATFGLGPTMVAATAASAIALVGISTSGSWPVFLVASGLLGVGGGLVDSSTNAYVAMRRGTRAMGAIHGVFGVGAVLGPLLATALMQAGFSWRVAYGVLALAQAVFVAALWYLARELDDGSEKSQRVVEAGFWRTPTLLWSLAVFFVYAGIGMGAGVWAFTYLTDGRGIGDGLGGVVVAGYWGALTASRLLLGSLGHRFPPDRMMRWAAASTLAAFIVLGLSDSSWMGAIALIFAGFSHGPIFPLQMLLTPLRVGPALTSHTVGYEIAAANVGAALLPGVMGFAVGVAGINVIPLLLVINAALLVVSVEVLRRQPTLSPVRN